MKLSKRQNYGIFSTIGDGKMGKKRKEIAEEAFEVLDEREKISTLEKFYADATLDNLPELVENKKEEMVLKLGDFQRNYVRYKLDRSGNKTKVVNPYLISTYFFKTVNPVHTKVPLYTPEKLSIVWDLYMYLIEQVNMWIAPFNPTLSHFCKFAGITLVTFNSYKTNGDDDMLTLCNKICDETMNSNFELAQNKLLNEKTTMSRLKVENQIVEKEQPRVNVNITAKANNVDLNEINKRLAEIQKFNKKTKELDDKKTKKVIIDEKQ